MVYTFNLIKVEIGLLSGQLGLCSQALAQNNNNSGCSLLVEHLPLTYERIQKHAKWDPREEYGLGYRKDRERGLEMEGDSKR